MFWWHCPDKRMEVLDGADKMTGLSWSQLLVEVVGDMGERRVELG